MIFLLDTSHIHMFRNLPLSTRRPATKSINNWILYRLLRATQSLSSPGFRLALQYECTLVWSLPVFCPRPARRAMHFLKLLQFHSAFLFTIWIKMQIRRNKLQRRRLGSARSASIRGERQLQGRFWLTHPSRPRLGLSNKQMFCSIHKIQSSIHLFPSNVQVFLKL